MFTQFKYKLETDNHEWMWLLHNLVRRREDIPDILTG